MAIIRYACPACGNRAAVFRTGRTSSPPMCPDCNSFMTRDARGPGVVAMERLDNGVMAKPVERFADAEKLFKERARENMRELKKDHGIE